MAVLTSAASLTKSATFGAAVCVSSQLSDHPLRVLVIARESVKSFYQDPPNLSIRGKEVKPGTTPHQVGACRAVTLAGSHSLHLPAPVDLLLFPLSRREHGRRDLIVPPLAV